MKGLSNVWQSSRHGWDNINNIYNTFPLINYALQQMKQFKLRTQVKVTCITSVKDHSYDIYNTCVKTCWILLYKDV